jgi:FdhD protein
MEAMGKSAEIFKATGGTHIACLGTESGEMLFEAEDIGRHNAVDKVIGKALLGGRDPGDLILCSSGRLSSEIVLKAVRARIPVLVSRSAPTSRSVELAEEFLVTMVGFARGGRMNVYAHPERIA